MRVSTYIGRGIAVGLLLLLPGLLAPSARGEQSGDPGPLPSQETNRDMPEGQPSVEPSTPAVGELGKESERPMKMPEREDSSAFRGQQEQMLDPSILEQISIQDEKSAVSF